MMSFKLQPSFQELRATVLILQIFGKADLWLHKQFKVLPCVLFIPCASEPPILIKKLQSSEQVTAGDQPRLIQGIRSGDGVRDLFNYLFIKDIKSNRIRIAQ